MATTTTTSSIIGATTTSSILDTTSTLLSTGTGLTTSALTTSSLLGTVTTDLTLTSTAIVSSSTSDSILSASTTFSADTTPSFSASSTSIFSAVSTQSISSAVPASASAAPSNSASVVAFANGGRVTPVAIAGIAIGAGALVVLIIFGSLCICLARKRRLRRSPPTNLENTTFLEHSSTRDTEDDIEKSRASSRTTDIDTSATLSPKNSMRGSTLLAPNSDRATGMERFSWKPQSAEHLQVSTGPEVRPFSWMEQEQNVYPLSPQQISPGSVPWRPASELLGQTAIGNGSPLAKPTDAFLAGSYHENLPRFNPGNIPHRNSSQSAVIMRDQIKQAFNPENRPFSSDRGAHYSLPFSPAPLSEPAMSRNRGSGMSYFPEDGMDPSSRFSGETLGKLKKDHERIQLEKARLSRLQQLDEEEDWIRGQIAHVESRRGSFV